MTSNSTSFRPTQKLLWAALCAVALAGCGSNVKLDDKNVPVESRTGTGSDSNTSGAAQSQVTPVDLTKNGGAGVFAGTGKVVYFDFDSYTVRDDARPVIDANAKVLAANKTAKLAVEGHTDERGGREYNLSLGQKRAEAVVRALTLAGATDGQLEPTSFGKERPAVSGSDEAAYAKNRRVELVTR
jgi:peptidoglycan-associated lipoprotein